MSVSNVLLIYTRIQGKKLTFGTLTVVFGVSFLRRIQLETSFSWCNVSHLRSGARPQNNGHAQRAKKKDQQNKVDCIF